MYQKIKSLQENKLIANSFYLFLASGVVAAFGFIFWTIIARTFPDSEVGLAATLLSLSSLISLLSLAGFDTTFVRFLSKSTRREDYINSGYVIAGGVSIFLSIIFLIGFPIYATDLLFVLQNPLYSLGFIVFNVFMTLNTLTNAVFLAYRQTFYTLVINTTFSLVKVVLPFFVIGGGVMAIFTISGIAQVVGVVLSFAILSRKFNHKMRFKVHFDVLKLSRKYAAAVYLSSVLNLLPPTVLPLIITNQLGAESSAYYYMAFTIATLLYTFAYAAMQSVFAEGSHVEDHLQRYLKKAAKALLIIMTPSIIILIALAPFILSVFGENYTDQGTSLLQIFALSGFAVALYSAAGAVFKVKHASESLIIMNIIYCVTIILISIILIPTVGLSAVGIGWMVGNILAFICGVGVYFYRRKLA